MTPEEQQKLKSMSAAEGAAAAEGLAILLHHLSEKGMVDEPLVSMIRDAMLEGLDYTVDCSDDDGGLRQAYDNTLSRFYFLSTPPRGLFYPEPDATAEPK